MEFGDQPIKILTKEEFAQNKPGYILAPYKTIETYLHVMDKDGIRKYRLVSRWVLFKLWIMKLWYGSKKL